jgi:hypothetical protein
MYTYDANVWDLSIVLWPFSVAPCQTLTFATCSFSLHAHGSFPRSPVLAPPPARWLFATHHHTDATTPCSNRHRSHHFSVATRLGPGCSHTLHHVHTTGSVLCKRSGGGSGGPCCCGRLQQVDGGSAGAWRLCGADGSTTPRRAPSRRRRQHAHHPPRASFRCGEQQSVATPQAARGWARPPYSHFKTQFLLTPWLCFRGGARNSCWVCILGVVER